MHVNHVELGKKNERTPLNVVQISDLQVSEYYETNRLDKVIEKVNAQKPDILLFTGDLFDNYSKYPEQRAPMIEKLKAFKANIGSMPFGAIMIMVVAQSASMKMSCQRVDLPC